MALVVAGVLARLLRYVACFPLREGEDYVAATLVTRVFADLHRPLAYETVCPVGFLWLEGLVVRALGISEYALRLVPLLFGIGALLQFARVARRTLTGPAGVFAAGFLAVAYQSIRQSAEAKHYTVDLFFAVLICGLTLGVFSAPRERRGTRMAGLAAAFPAAVVCSLTSAFVIAAATLAIGWTDAFEPGGAGRPGGPGVLRRLTPAAGLAALAVGCSAALWILQLSAVARAVHSTGALTEAWKGVYPPVSSPGRLSAWLLETHTGRMFAYPFGDKNLGSIATTVLFVLGLVEARRQRWTGVLLLVGAPFLLGLGAAFLRLYPYGDNDRLVVYLAPGICLMAGLGAATLLARLRREVTRERVLLAASGALVLAGLAVGFDSLRQPYAGLDDEQERAFARVFWRDVTQGGEAAAAWDDLRIALEPERWLWGDTGWAAAFRYYRARYGPPPWRTGDGRWSALGTDHPLRIVTWSPRADPPPERESAWLDSIASRLRLVRRRDLSANPPSHYLVYELVPAGPGAAPLQPFPPP
jgi:hypothetical protein